MLDNDGFIFKVEYNAARAFLERMKVSQKKDDDYFNGKRQIGRQEIKRQQ